MAFSRKGLLLALCLVTSQLSAQKLVNRTFVALPRAKATATCEFAAHRAHQNSDNDINTSVHVGGFYSQSTNGTRLGKGLWVDGTNVIKVGADDSDSTTYLHIPKTFLQDSSAAYGNLAAKISLTPLRSVWGINLAANHKLAFLSENLSVGIALPVMQVGHDLQANLISETKVGSVSAMDYFLGNYSDTSGADQQAKLTSAKFAGKKLCKTGVASVDLSIGYDFINEEKSGARARLFTRIATGNKVTGEFLFEPILGNGGHHELGVAFDTALELYQSDNLTINLNTSSALAYAFEATEVRTVNYRSYDNASAALLAAQYRNFGKSGVTGVQPGANILTLPLTIRPGFVTDLAADLNFRFGKFGAKLGCASTIRSAESAVIQSFTDGVYALAKTTYDGNSSFTLGTGNSAADCTLTKSLLDTAGCTTPASCTTKVEAGFAWYPTVASFDLCAEVHGGFEFAPGNVNVEEFNVGASLGVSF